LGLTAADFLEPELVIQIGRPPYRIDLLTSISGVSCEQAWATREMVGLAEKSIPRISRELLLVNNRASGRLQDLADVARLEAPPLSPDPLDS